MFHEIFPFLPGDQEHFLSKIFRKKGFSSRQEKRNDIHCIVPFCLNRQRPTFPGSLPPSILSAGELNFCVRDGYRCLLPAFVTGFTNPSPVFLENSGRFYARIAAAPLRGNLRRLPSVYFKQFSLFPSYPQN